MNFGLETELAHSYDHMVQKGQTTQTDNSTNYTRQQPNVYTWK